MFAEKISACSLAKTVQRVMSKWEGKLQLGYYSSVKLQDRCSLLGGSFLVGFVFLLSCQVEVIKWHLIWNSSVVSTFRLGRLVKPLTNSEQSNGDSAVQMKKTHTSLGERTYDVERNNFWENQTSKAKQFQMNQWIATGTSHAFNFTALNCIYPPVL